MTYAFGRRSCQTSYVQDNLYQRAYFDCLPLELKLEIFAHCAAIRPRLSSAEAPLLLCRVSSSWRAVVLSAPKLWATFMLDALDVTDQGKIKLLRLWLERSRNSPLSFQLFQGRQSDQALVALTQHARRWCDVDLRLPNSSSIFLQSSPLLDQLPNLKSLTYHTKGPRSTSIPFNIHALRIPWRQLTILNLDLDSNQILDLTEFANILSQSIHLTRCIINADYTFNSQSMSKIVLPALIQLDISIQQKDSGDHSNPRITDTAESCLVSFLERLDMPRLQTLGLRWLLKQDDGHIQWRDVHSRFISVLRAVASSLHSLTIAYLPLSDGQVLDCLADLHGLSHLDLRFSLADKERDPITDAFLRACVLRPDASSPALVPYLQSIYLQSTGARHRIVQVMEVVRSRWDPVRHGAGLQSFGLVSMKPVSSLTRQQLKQYAEEGLEVFIEEVVIR